MFHIYKKRAWMKWLRVFNAVVVLSLALQPVSPVFVLADSEDDAPEAVVEVNEGKKIGKLDLSEYEDALNAVDEDDYTKDSWEAYQKIVQEHEVGEDNSQDEVNDATEAIEKAQKDLVKKADLSEYEDVLGAVDEEDYTEDSWAAYMQVVKVNAVDENDSQDTIDEAAQNIRDAQKDLVKDNPNIPNEPTVEAEGEASTEKEPLEDATEGESEEETEEKEDAALAEWLADAGNDGYEIVEVTEGETYEYGDDGFSIIFTGIDGDVAEAYRVIGIQEVTLTEEQQEALGALSETAYDVISPMENGDFEYELTLPTPDDVDEASVDIVYAETEEDLDEPEKIEVVDDKDVSVDTDKQETKVKALDHFTIFVVTSSDADYVGNWIHYSSQGYENGGVDYPTTIPSGQTATWNFSSLSSTPADYDVYISWSTHENRTTSAPYTLNHNGGTDGFSINQEQLADQSTNGGSGEWSGWYHLGKYSLDNGSNLVLESVDNSSRSDYVIADTVAIVDDTNPLNVWVDDDYTQFGVNDYHIWGYNAFSTIQAGIDAAGEGGSVHVAAGTYEENIGIDKTLTLIGAQAGVDPRPSQGGRSGGESIIKSSSTAVTIDADNVVFNGFTVESHVISSSYNVVEAVDVGFPTVIYNIVHNVDPGANSNEGIKIRRSGGSGALVSYNYVYDIPSPGDAIGFDTVDNGEISYNEIRNIGSSNAAVYVYSSSNTLIKENLVDTTTQNDGIKLGSKNGDDAYETGGIIEKNVIENTAQDGISVYMSNTRVEDNDISGSNSENGALYLAFDISNVEILGNAIHDNSLSTGKRTDAGAITLHSNVYADSVRVNNNLIYGNTPYQLTNLSADELDATLNWWGSAEFSDIAPKISGNVDYNPWCLDEDCTETTKGLYSKTKIKTLSSRGQNVKVGGLRIKNITGSGELFVAKYKDKPEVGGLRTGVDGFYYDIQYSGTIDFPVKVVIKYSDNPSKSNYLDESKFTSLYYYDEASDEWKDYREDDPASSVEINTAKNKITAHLEHFTPIVVAADTTAPTITFDEPVSGSVHNGIVHLKATCDEECDYVNFWWRAEGEPFDSASKRYHYVRDNGTTFEWDLNTLNAEKADGSTYTMTDGVYYLYAAGKDVVGNWARTTGEVEIIVDNTAPTVEITSPTESLLTGTVEVRGTVMDENPRHYWLQIKKDGSVLPGYGTEIENNSFTDRLLATLTDDGEYEVTLAARDAAGGTASSGNRSGNVVVSFTIDNTAPAVPTGLRRIAPDESGKEYACGAVSQIQRMWPDWDDNAEPDFSHYEYSSFNPTSQGIDERRFDDSIFEYTGGWLPGEGTYGFAVRAVDEAGNKSDWALSGETLEGSCQITYDSTAPVVTLVDPMATSIHAGYFHLKATCDEECDFVNFWWRAEGETYDPDERRYRYFPENGTVYEWDLNSLAAEKADRTTYVMEDGTYYVYAAGSDPVGNWSRSEEHRIVIDNTAPESTIDGGEDGERVYVNEWDGSISGTASDNLSGVNRVELSIMRESDGAYYDGGSWIAGETFVTATGTESWTYILPSPAEGTYTIVSHAADEAGNREESYTLTIVYDITIPEVDLTIDPSDPDGDNDWYVSIPEITLIASDNFDLEKIEYRFEDDADWTVYTGPVAVTDGKRVFSYRATDKAGNVTDTGVKNVKVDTEEPDMIDDLNAKYEDGTIFLEWDVDDSDIHDVYIYRGRSKTFSKDRHSLTAKVDADDDDYEDDNTELDKTYYYKLVSRDEAGNTSDSRIISVRTPDEEGGEAIVTDEGTEPTGTGTTGGGETGIAGEEETVSETDTEAGEGEVAGEETEPEGEVEGVTTESRSYWWILWILLAVTAGYTAYRRFVGRGQVNQS